VGKKTPPCRGTPTGGQEEGFGAGVQGGDQKAFGRKKKNAFIWEKVWGVQGERAKSLMSKLK